MRKAGFFLFWFLLVVFVVTFFTKNDYRGIAKIHPAVLYEPVQIGLGEKGKIIFVRDGYEYEVSPLYFYEISGVVVSAMDYTWFSLFKRDSVFPKDVCLVWGENIESEVFREKKLKFKQDFRFCIYEWSGDVKFNAGEISNNHLIVTNEDAEKSVKEIRKGDQIRIKGVLADVKARSIGELGKYDPESFVWNSSVSRDDSGAGACETILVESVEILEKGNPISLFLNKVSFYGLVAVITFAIVRFIIVVASVGKPRP